MIPVLVLACVTGVPLSEDVVDRLVSTRTVTVQRQVMLKFAVLTGDPLGSREDGTIKCLAEPHLTALHKQAATFLAGRMADAATGQTAEGIEIKVTPRIRLDGKISVECETSLHTVNTGRGITTAAGFAPGVDTQTMQTTAALKPGETFKVRLSAKSATEQTWMELTASVVDGSHCASSAEAAKMTWAVTNTATANTTAPPQLVQTSWIPPRTMPAVLPAPLPVVPMRMPPPAPMLPDTPDIRPVQLVAPTLMPTSGK